MSPATVVMEVWQGRAPPESRGREGGREASWGGCACISEMSGAPSPSERTPGGQARSPSWEPYKGVMRSHLAEPGRERPVDGKVCCQAAESAGGSRVPERRHLQMDFLDLSSNRGVQGEVRDHQN